MSDNEFVIRGREKKVRDFLRAFDEFLGRPIRVADMDMKWSADDLREIYRRAGVKKASDETLTMLAQAIRDREAGTAGVWSPKELGEAPSDSE